MPAYALANGGHDAGRLSGLENDHDLVGLGPLEIGRHEVVTPSSGRVDNGCTPFLGTVLDPVVELLGDVTQTLAGDSLAAAISIEETNDSLGLLERLDQAVEQDAVKAAVVKFNAMLMMFVEGVHGVLQ